MTSSVWINHREDVVLQRKSHREHVEPYGKKVEEGKIHSLAGVEVQTELRRTSTMLGSGRVGEDKFQNESMKHMIEAQGITYSWWITHSEDQDTVPSSTQSNHILLVDYP